MRDVLSHPRWATLVSPGLPYLNGGCIYMFEVSFVGDVFGNVILVL